MYVCKYLDSKERGENNVGKYNEINFIEEASCHEDDENEVHNWEYSESDTLHYGVGGGEMVVDNDHGHGYGYQQTQQRCHVVLVHTEEVALI